MFILNHYYKALFFFFSILFLVSCNTEGIPENENIVEPETIKEEVEVIPEVELFERLDILGINQKIVNMEELLSPSQIMKIYYPVERESNEGNESVEINEKSLEHEEMEVSLIHDYLMDDAIKAYKYIMLLKKQDGKWKVISLKKNWKCYKRRGHSFWGITACS